MPGADLLETDEVGKAVAGKQVTKMNWSRIRLGNGPSSRPDDDHTRRAQLRGRQVKKWYRRFDVP